MSDEHADEHAEEYAARELSTLTGTSRTLERAVYGMQSSAARLLKMLDDDAAEHPPTAGLTRLADALRSLSADELAVVNAALGGHGRPKRKGK